MASNQAKIPWTRVLVEGVVIVVSILLAFGIDAWWDELQEDRRRVELLEDLQGDFDRTREELQGSLARADSILAAVETLGNAMDNPETIVVDSLVRELRWVYGVPGFIPTVPHYRAAIAAGTIGLIESDSLLHFLGEFDVALGVYNLFLEGHRDFTYVGALRDLSREYGSPLAFLRVPAADLPGTLQSPLVQAARNYSRNMTRTLQSPLQVMESATDGVLRELERLLER